MSTLSNQQQSNSLSLKEKSISFLQKVASGNIREANQKYISPDFLHHNPFFPGDSKSLMLAMEENATENSHKSLEIKLAIQENDMVTVYSHIKQNPEDLGSAVVHIFRFKDDQIVEMWDVGQPIPKDSPNQNGMF
ncbi:nuclear transport factor 2 family protein [Psychrobacillus antarcticus]|uniref:nuclear transport factor 2 family protein n=1 Tax=Psychrobacillus antarcticus TaxID=2879115 RepID=UPI00240852C1|nr:nuclear transport factor 2 family protein [Psychrobacillus antarcticus]